MTNQNKNKSCQFGCWAIAAGVGLLTFIMLLAVGGFAFLAAIFLGGLVFVFLGFLLNWLFCTPLPAEEAETSAAASSQASASTGTTATGSTMAASSSAAQTATATASSTEASEAAQDNSAADAATAETSGSSAGSGESSATAADSSADAATLASEASAATSGTGVSPSKELPGQDDLASRKGEWTYNSEETAASGDAGNASADTTDAAASSKAAASAPSDASAEAAAPKAKKASGAAKSKATKKAAKTSAAAKPASDDSVDFDGDGVVEGTNEGSKPAVLSAAREGGADDLKRIKGIGPKLEGVCNDLGFFHFDQIAAWTPDELAWVNSNLVGFKGRATRDDWIGQAKLLASGGETAFSKRVDKGSVY
jgi:predicted flap endonuclease-1-like 5' DNA nuclease